MKCPVDGTTLMIADRAGVEIDYCPQCRGVWLDRGELDKIIERSNGAARSAPPRPAPGGYKGSYKGSQGQYRKKKSGLSLLEDIFDF